MSSAPKSYNSNIPPSVEKVNGLFTSVAEDQQKNEQDFYKVDSNILELCGVFPRVPSEDRVLKALSIFGNAGNEKLSVITSDEKLKNLIEPDIFSNGELGHYRFKDNTTTEDSRYHCTLPDCVKNKEDRNPATGQKSKRKENLIKFGKLVLEKRNFSKADIIRIANELPKLAPTVAYRDYIGIYKYIKAKYKGGIQYSKETRSKMEWADKAFREFKGTIIFSTFGFASKKFTISREDACKIIAEEFTKYKRAMRDRYGIVSYDVLEFTENGYPHFHMLMKVPGVFFSHHYYKPRHGKGFEILDDRSFHDFQQEHYKCGFVRTEVLQKDKAQRYLQKYLCKEVDDLGLDNDATEKGYDGKEKLKILSTVESVIYNMRQFHISTGLKKVVKRMKEELHPEEDPGLYEKDKLKLSRIVSSSPWASNFQFASSTLLAILNNATRKCKCNGKIYGDYGGNERIWDSIRNTGQVGFYEELIFRKGCSSMGCPGCVISNFRDELARLCRKGLNYNVENLKFEFGHLIGTGYIDPKTVHHAKPPEKEPLGFPERHPIDLDARKKLLVEMVGRLTPESPNEMKNRFVDLYIDAFDYPDEAVRKSLRHLHLNWNRDQRIISKDMEKVFNKFNPKKFEPRNSGDNSPKNKGKNLDQ